MFSKYHSLRRRDSSFLISFMLLGASLASAQLVPGSMDGHWNEGAPNCSSSSQPPIEVHQYAAKTFILRENLCSTFEAPFMYLLVGSNRALLIDTGDVADPSKMPLAKTALDLLPEAEPGKPASEKVRLLVVHTHHHLDHRAGDGQFTGMPNVQVIGVDLAVIRSYFNFVHWPEGIAQIDLGDRTVDVIPTPGHNDAEISFYDRNTGLFFSGDFLLPGRLLISDKRADLASAERVSAFVKDRPVSFVLGGHVEMNSQGELFPWGSQYHPAEHALALKKDDLLALPSAVRSFNGFYAVSGQFTMEDSIHILIAIAVLALGFVITLVWLLVRYIRRRKNRKRAKQAFPGSTL